jgi:ABC-type glycerol-3-phosphate transport system substrate-binding protein
MHNMFTIGAENALYNWNNLTHVDGTTPWWDAKSFNLSIANRLYVVNNDISVNTTSRARFLYYNKAIHEENNLEDPYALVRSGEWTWDKFAAMVTAISEDLDGSGTYDGYDRYGLLWERPEYFWTGCEVLLTTKGEGDIPQIACISERTVDVLAKIKELNDDKQHVISYHTAASGMDTSAFPQMVTAFSA